MCDGRRPTSAWLKKYTALIKNLSDVRWTTLEVRENPLCD